MAWLLGTAEVDINLGQAYWSDSCDTKPLPQLEFWKKLALKMINNQLDDYGRTEEESSWALHERAAARVMRAYCLIPKLHGRWLDNRWNIVATEYSQRQRSKKIVEIL